MKTAIVVGASGLVGSNLVKLLIEDSEYQKIIQVGRRPFEAENSKVDFVETNFKNLETIAPKIKGDVLFSCLGTTIKKAGSKDAQFEVDYTYQYKVAEIASKNQVNDYVLISSVGAHANSRVFYSKIKGKLEQAISKLSFEHIVILRPSFLIGKRGEKRFGEQLGALLSKVFKFIPVVKKYRAIKAKTVAKAMLVVARNTHQVKKQIFEADQLFHLADQF